MSREFIDREHQQPADARSAAGANSAGNAQMDSLATTPRGEPPKAFDVRAVYDSRPVQGIDYNITDSAQTTFALETTNKIDVSFVVPSGYVAVQRKARVLINTVSAVTGNLTAPPAFLNRQDVLLTFLIAGSTIRYNENIPVGIESDDLADGFFIADEYQTVTARITFSADAAYAIFENVIMSATVTFYGNLLLKTGVPSPFEVANPTDKIWTPTGRVDLPSIPSPSDTRVRRQSQPITAPAPVVMQTLTSVPPPAPVQPPARRALSSGSAGRSPVYDSKTGKIIGYR